MVDTNKLVEALKQLDPENDEHWTEAGLPSMKAVEAAYGDSEPSRDDVEAALPGLNREIALEAAAAAEEESTPEPVVEEESLTEKFERLSAELAETDDDHQKAQLTNELKNIVRDPEYQQQARDRRQEEANSAPKVDPQDTTVEKVVNPDFQKAFDEADAAFNEAVKNLNAAKTAHLEAQKARNEALDVLKKNTPQESFADQVKALQKRNLETALAKKQRQQEVLATIDPKDLDPRSPADRAAAARAQASRAERRREAFKPK